MADLLLKGLDGSNPLAFLAALGTLRAVEEMPMGVRLSWRDEGVWRPVLHGFKGDLDCLARLLDEDRSGFSDEPALDLSYGDEVRDLKPPPEEFRRYLEALVANATLAGRRSVDLAAAFATDVAVDNAGKTKPTALHFTAGQQLFLAMVRELQEKVTADDLLEAVAGPWTYSRSLPVLAWDNTTNRDYALRARDPSGDKKTGIPGADWLALRGLSFIRVFPKGRRILTTGCSGGWKDGSFCWPLWTTPIGCDVITSLVGLDVARMGVAERRARGIGAVFECSIRRSDQGGYGSFLPPRPVLA